jgi:hypothetical protein
MNNRHINLKTKLTCNCRWCHTFGVSAVASNPAQTQLLLLPFQICEELYTWPQHSEMLENRMSRCFATKLRHYLPTISTTLDSIPFKVSSQLPHWDHMLLMRTTLALGSQLAPGEIKERSRRDSQTRREASHSVSEKYVRCGYERSRPRNDSKPKHLRRGSCEASWSTRAGFTALPKEKRKDLCPGYLLQ